MKFAVLFLTILTGPFALAEYDATYCGKFIEGKAGSFWSGQPDLIIAIECQIEGTGGGKSCVPTGDGFGAVVGLNAEDMIFANKAIKNGKTRDTLYCVKARWSGGPVYDSDDIENISLATDIVMSVGYFSDM